MEHCPSCRAPRPAFEEGKRWTCAACGWVYFHNVAAAVMAVLTLGDKVLFVERSRAPGKGLLDCPGGFVDPGESAEQALARELREELALEGLDFRYIGSAPNTYPYRGVTYRTCDLIYTAALQALPSWWAPSEIAGIVLRNPREVTAKELAFASVEGALGLWLERSGRPQAP